MIAEKACFDVLCTRKAISLSKMARLVWRYSDDAGAIIENVYKKIVEEKKKAQDEQQQPKQPPSSTSKVSLDDFDKGVV